jgi:hypothetical protein
MTFTSSVLNLFAPTIKVAWQSSDVLRWRNAPITSTPTALLSAPASTATTDLPPPGLSTGAKAGIGIGVSAAAVVIAAAAFLFWRRRTKWRKIPREEKLDTQKAELPGQGKKHVELADEAGVHETEGGDKPKEVAEMRAPAELESDWTGWEAPALLEVELSRSAPDQARLEDNDVGQDVEQNVEHENSRQQTPITMVARQ